MRMMLGALALTILPVCAWAQDGEAVCPFGEHVLVTHEGRERAAWILEGPNADGACLVVIEGILYDTEAWIAFEASASSAATAAVPAEAPVGGGVCVAGAAVNVEWEGAWYPGHVLDGPRADGSCYISYDGYDSSWDEWATPDRLQPLAGLCVPGAAVDVAWQGQWYPGHVLDGPRPDGTCYITYDGYDSSWDEWVTPARLQPIAGLCVPGAAVDVEWQGSWYPGHVLQGPDADGTCYITYDGYDASWDEWVTPARLRAQK